MWRRARVVFLLALGVAAVMVAAPGTARAQPVQAPENRRSPSRRSSEVTSCWANVQGVTARMIPVATAKARKRARHMCMPPQCEEAYCKTVLSPATTLLEW